MKIRFQTGYTDIRKNNEDLILTPCLSLVNVKTYNLKIRIYGFAVNWIYYSFYIGIGFNVPIELPYFINHSRK